MGKKRVELTPAQQKAKEKERVIAMYESGMSVPEIERITGKPHSTIYRWLNEYKTTDEGVEIEQKRAYCKQRFIEDAWEGLGGVMLATKTRIARIRDMELKAADIIEKLQDDSINDFERQEFLKQLEALKTASVGDLTSLINTLYERQAAASGESVSDNKIEIVINGWKESWDD